MSKEQEKTPDVQDNTNETASLPEEAAEDTAALNQDTAAETETAASEETETEETKTEMTVSETISEASDDASESEAASTDSTETSAQEPEGETPADDAEAPAESSEEAEPDEEVSSDTDKTEEKSSDDKSDETAETPSDNRILAIKSALRQHEEQEEMEHAIASKIRKYKDAKDNPEAAKKEKKAKAKQDKKDKKKKGKNAAPQKKYGPIRSLFPHKGDGPLEVMRKCIFLSSSAIFVACLCMIGDYFWDNYQNAQLSDNLRDIYTQEVEEETEPTEATISPDENYEYFAYLNGAEKLLEINPDVCGWLTIPGTQINYPVLQRKGQEDGNDYYLKRNINGENAHAGSIFMDFRNDFDYVVDHKRVAPNSTNLIIYGHNMHDYSMFGSLKHFINDAEYYGEHPIVELNSNYRRYKYKIFGMIIVDIDDETETKFDYWNQLNFDDEEAFYNYVNEVKRRTIRLNDVPVEYGDQLLTLSTCNSTFSDGRLVIFARLLRDGEDLYEGTQESIANPNIKWPNSYYRWHKNTYDPDAEFVPYG
ncbi:MAG: class B sortase [Oscillospiraceae bacterium]|nr:class B sortase [Oscillospiraceae bacterium]